MLTQGGVSASCTASPKRRPQGSLPPAPTHGTVPGDVDATCKQSVAHQRFRGGSRQAAFSTQSLHLSQLLPFAPRKRRKRRVSPVPRALSPAADPAGRRPALGQTEPLRRKGSPGGAGWGCWGRVLGNSSLRLRRPAPRGCPRPRPGRTGQPRAAWASPGVSPLCPGRGAWCRPTSLRTRTVSPVTGRWQEHCCPWSCGHDEETGDSRAQGTWAPVPAPPRVPAASVNGTARGPRDSPWASLQGDRRQAGPHHGFLTHLEVTVW